MYYSIFTLFHVFAIRPDKNRCLFYLTHKRKVKKLKVSNSYLLIYTAKRAMHTALDKNAHGRINFVPVNIK